ncbi:LisH domain-containing protein, putative [Plasmodium ovale]|uniref:Uncharacterized protein n=2 Tax=Plasmodium ovale TaxID=36330 RepID=A0A1A8WY20_PLAOA|nr:conserved Plasmodium protein, unknown function [Plasmodium ovale curtisi]SBS97858.1 conserved Plasmodium protein, unknown function [Plasmodium ovale curtisi]SCQ16676.1 LisH domain-containing protein, putative [Plasmodium ovale]
MKIHLSSDEVNLLVYRYLVENGFVHTSYAFFNEGSISKNTYYISHGDRLPSNALVSFLQKALIYIYIEYHTDNNNGKKIICEEPFSFFRRHECWNDENDFSEENKIEIRNNEKISSNNLNSFTTSSNVFDNNSNNNDSNNNTNHDSNHKNNNEKCFERSDDVINGKHNEDKNASSNANSNVNNNDNNNGTNNGNNSEHNNSINNDGISNNNMSNSNNSGNVNNEKNNDSNNATKSKANGKTSIYRSSFSNFASLNYNDSNISFKDIKRNYANIFAQGKTSKKSASYKKKKNNNDDTNNNRNSISTGKSGSNGNGNENGNDADEKEASVKEESNITSGNKRKKARTVNPVSKLNKVVPSDAKKNSDASNSVLPDYKKKEDNISEDPHIENMESNNFHVSNNDYHINSKNKKVTLNKQNSGNDKGEDNVIGSFNVNDDNSVNSGNGNENSNEHRSVIESVITSTDRNGSSLVKAKKNQIRNEFLVDVSSNNKSMKIAVKREIKKNTKNVIIKQTKNGKKVPDKNQEHMSELNNNNIPSYNNENIDNVIAVSNCKIINDNMSETRINVKQSGSSNVSDNNSLFTRNSVEVPCISRKNKEINNVHSSYDRNVNKGANRNQGGDVLITSSLKNSNHIGNKIIHNETTSNVNLKKKNGTNDGDYNFNFSKCVNNKNDRIFNITDTVHGRNDNGVINDIRNDHIIENDQEQSTHIGRYNSCTKGNVPTEVEYMGAKYGKEYHLNRRIAQSGESVVIVKADKKEKEEEKEECTLEKKEKIKEKNYQDICYKYAECAEYEKEGNTIVEKKRNNSKSPNYEETCKSESNHIHFKNITHKILYKGKMMYNIINKNNLVGRHEEINEYEQEINDKNCEKRKGAHSDEEQKGEEKSRENDNCRKNEKLELHKEEMDRYYQETHNEYKNFCKIRKHVDVENEDYESQRGDKKNEDFSVEGYTLNVKSKYERKGNAEEDAENKEIKFKEDEEEKKEVNKGGRVSIDVVEKDGE